MTGPFETSTPSGKRYALIFVDDYSRRTFVRLLKTKDEFFKEFQELDNVIEVETTKRVAFLRSDSDGAYTSGELAEYCRKRGIQRQFSTAYNQFQNGVAERTIRTLVEMTRTMLIHAFAPKSMWGECICYPKFSIENHRKLSKDF
jgi:transposase InsO family protein